MYWGTCVVLPQPVSPASRMTWCARTAPTICSLHTTGHYCRHMGRFLKAHRCKCTNQLLLADTDHIMPLMLEVALHRWSATLHANSCSG